MLFSHTLPSAGLGNDRHASQEAQTDTPWQRKSSISLALVLHSAASAQPLAPQRPLPCGPMGHPMVAILQQAFNKQVNM